MLPLEPSTNAPVPADVTAAATPPLFPPGRRVAWLRSLAAIALAAGLLLSMPLWVGPRSFPFAPPLSFAIAIPAWFDLAAYGSMLAALVVTVVVGSRVSIVVALVMAAALACRDQMRWQPWFYQYCFMLAALGSCASDAEDARQEAVLNTCRLILASLYFYSGVQKLNPAFVQEVLPWMLQPVGKLVPASLHLVPPSSGFMLAFLEIGIGAGLLTNRFRRAAIVLASAMCVFVLAAIGPFGQDWNTVVWPWNLAMVGFVWLLFAGIGNVSFRAVLWSRRAVLQRIVLVLFAVMPALSFVNLWDSYLSASLYSGNTTRADMYLSDALIGRLPGHVARYVTPHKESRSTLNYFQWAYDELNVPPYPEGRVYRAIAGAVCTYAEDDADVVVILRAKRSFVNSRRESTYNCSELKTD